jgi:hypothetical protein
MRPPLCLLLILAVRLAVPGAALAECPAGAPAHDVPYECTAAAPYLDYVGVCVPKDTGYYCGTRCTVCFCGSSFSLRTRCPAPDAGEPDVESRTSGCRATPARSSSHAALAGCALLAGLATWRRRERATS